MNTMVSGVMEISFQRYQTHKKSNTSSKITELIFSINFSLRLSNNTSHASVDVPSKSASNVVRVDLFNFFNSTPENQISV